MQRSNLKIQHEGITTYLYDLLTTRFQAVYADETTNALSLCVNKLDPLSFSLAASNLTLYYLPLLLCVKLEDPLSSSLALCQTY